MNMILLQKAGQRCEISGYSTLLCNYRVGVMQLAKYSDNLFLVLSILFLEASL